MKKALGRVWTVILAWLFIMILVTFFTQARYYYGSNPVVRPRQGVVEPFADKKEVVGENPDINMNGMSPGTADLAKPREPYSLLGNWLQLADTPLYKTAQGCHEVDFQTRLERTGNFRQLTNNYKRGDPDSCSAPIQDLTFAIYKNDPVPLGDCIQPHVEK